MNFQSVSGTAVWRLPNERKLSCLINGDGEDAFVACPFEKERGSYWLKGSIGEISQDELVKYFSSWRYTEATDKSSTSQGDYMAWVENARSMVENRQLTKVVLAQKQWRSSQTNIVDLFKALLEHYPGAFVYTFNLDGEVMIGASPETLLRKNDGSLYTEALGGTRTAGMYSEKEAIEHRHIREYIEQILGLNGYSFSPGSAEPRKAGNVEHLQTSYRLAAKGYQKDLVLAFSLHPTSAVCGMPYQAALDLIRQSEDFDRKYYSGFVGPVWAGKDFDLFVNLRCASVHNEGFTLYAGAGLNELSDPQAEWDETIGKMSTIGQWLK